MARSQFSALFLLPLVVLTNPLFGNTESTSKIKGLDSLFNEIGFSPSCVSQALAGCEKSAEDLSLMSFKSKLESIRESLEKFSSSQRRPRHCADLLKSGSKQSGVQAIYPYSCCENRPVYTLCDQDTDEGGWTVIQHRENLPQRENFYRDWIDYKIGFGNLKGEFWLGLDNIHSLTSSTLMELRVDLEDYEGEKKWAKYEKFYIDDISDNYRLSLGAYSGNAGDSLTRQNGQMFSTKDKDNDVSSNKCAVQFKGAWWYSSCHDSNLNAFQYEGAHQSHADGINWKAFRGHKYSLRITTMSLRPKFRQ